MTTIALSSAVSSLLVLEKQMSVVSNNISNANTAGYTAETLNVGENVANGIGGGVVDLGITSNVDQFLQASVLQANSVSTQSTTYNTYYQNLQQLMGQITSSNTGGNDLSSQLATLQATFSQLASTPQNVSLGNQAIANLDDLTSNLRNLSTQIQQLRTSADQQITDTVNDANTQLNTINSLNTQIETAMATGQTTAGLQDQRTQALQQLSADIGIGYYTATNGGLQIFTTQGVPLLTGNVVNPLSHTAVSISGNNSYPSGGIGGIMVGNNDITTGITSGKLYSLVQQRDQELPNAQNSLDYLAQQLSAGLNAQSNLGSASPPPSSLTSAPGAAYQSTDAVAPSSNLMVRIALVDSSGQVQNYQDVNLSGAATVGDIVTDINTAFGNTVASINGTGQLVLSSPTAGLGVAVSTLSGTLNTPANTTDIHGNANDTDFSSFFHLNDVVTGGNSAATISVNPSMLKNSSLLPVATLNSTVQSALAGTAQQNGAPPFAGVGAGDGSAAADLSTALLNSQTFTTGTATSTQAFNSANSSLQLSGTFVINGGSAPIQVSVTAGETLANIASAIQAAATAAGVSGVNAQVIGNGIYQLQITSGGNQLSFSAVSGDVLQGLGISSNSPTGYLGAATTTFGGFASNLISDIASRASSANDDQTAKQATLSALQTSLSNQSGVNVDQQTAQLTQLQNLYAASARVITTVNAMFSSLISAVNA
jgi:flagellar hook-associated protein 1 FlgK